MASRTAPSILNLRHRRSVGWTSVVIASCGAFLLGAGALTWVNRPAGEVAPKQERVYVPTVDTVNVVVVDEHAREGTPVSSLAVRTVPFPRHHVPPEAVASLQGLEHLVLTAPLPQGVPLLRTHLGERTEARNPVSDQIPPGMRAIAIRVDATSAVEGWARSGSLVDVVLVTPQETRVIAERVRVLSAERSVAPVDNNTAPVPSTVTLLVTRQQVLALSAASPLGRLQLALRGHDDEMPWNNRVFVPHNLQGIAGREERVMGTAKFGQKQMVLVDGTWRPANSTKDEQNNE